jgi:DNA-binding CsgD family transcriptional regulator
VAQPLIGRTAELETIGGFLAAERTRGLLLEGTAGIGKTRLWLAALDLARERRDRVLVSRPAGADRELSFAGIADLLEGTVDDVVPRLSPPQRRALEVALLLRDPEGEPADDRAVAASFLACLRLLARDQAVVLAVDDLQWLDRESSQVLGFALQRLAEEPVSLLATVRIAAEEREPAEVRRALGDTLTRVQLEPMSVGGIFELLRTRLGLKLSRPTLMRVYDASDGNPFYSLELGRALRDVGGEPKPGEPLPVPRELSEVVQHRLRRLSPSASETLLLAASLSRPTFAAVQAACETAERAESDLTEARDADIIEFEGDVIRFAHPLLASIHYGSATPWERRAAHARLAASVDDPEERARHLALSAVGPDEETAMALEEAAERASRRGALASAAELANRALSATPSEAAEAVHRRRLAAAQNLHSSGDTAGAIALVEDALRHTSAGDARAELLWTLGKMRFKVHRRRGIEAFRLALDEVGEDAPLRARILESLSLGGSARMEEFAESETYARKAAAVAERTGDTATLARALARLGTIRLFITGRVEPELFDRAVAIEESLGGLELDDSPTAVYAWSLFSASMYDRARELYEPLCERGRRRGDPAVGHALQTLAAVEFYSGNWSRAEELAQEAHELAVQTGREAAEMQPLLTLAKIEAARGNVDTARATCQKALATTEGHWWGAEGVLAFIELSLENYEAACELIQPITGLWHDLGASFIAEELYAVEALADLRKVEEGYALLAPGEAEARATGSPWMRAAVVRARGLLAAAADDLEAAEASLEEAVDVGTSAGDPFELGRSLLALGTIRRRLRRKQAAREALTLALENFDGLGARIWAGRTRRELARIGGRSAPRSKLSATEAQIAALVGAGRSNQEVAAALHLSPKTIEWNLSKIYRKLGVHSRTEMAAKLAARG